MTLTFLPGVTSNTVIHRQDLTTDKTLDLTFPNLEGVDKKHDLGQKEIIIYLEHGCLIDRQS